MQEKTELDYMKLVMLQEAKEFFIKKMENRLELEMKAGNIFSNLIKYAFHEYVF